MSLLAKGARKYATAAQKEEWAREEIRQFERQLPGLPEGSIILTVEKTNCHLCGIQRMNDGLRCCCGAYENLDIVPVSPDRVCRFCTAPRGKREGTTMVCVKCNASPVLTNRAFKAPSSQVA